MQLLDHNSTSSSKTKYILKSLRGLSHIFVYKKFNSRWMCQNDWFFWDLDVKWRHLQGNSALTVCWTISLGFVHGSAYRRKPLSHCFLSFLRDWEVHPCSGQQFFEFQFHLSGSTKVIFAMFKLQKVTTFFFLIFSTQHLQNHPTSFSLSHLLKTKQNQLQRM